MTSSDPATVQWWSRAVFYQVYPRSFRDSNGDGIGDLDGVIGRLDYLELLGVDAIWLNPVTVSPMADHGYDVSDPRDVDPLFGGIDALDRLVDAAHRRDIKITMDLVPNHTSSAHPWFRAALAASPGSVQRERYIFRDGSGPGSIHPPNNWLSVFGGSAWTRVVEPDGNPGQWYLHLFDAEQPDLNWDNPEVFDDLEKTLRFWLERGVDGFRIDVAHGMAKPPGLPDMEITEAALLRISDDDPRFNHQGVHDIHRAIRSVLNDYPGAVSIGEVWVEDNARSRIPARRRVAPGFQLPASAGRFRRGRDPRCRSKTPWPQSHSWAPCRPGRWKAMMPSGPSPATAAAKPGWRGRARWRRRCLPCRVPRSSITAKSLGCRTWICPTRRCRIRCGNAPGTRGVAATAAGCRCRGAATLPRSGSRRTRRPGCRSRRNGRR